MNTESCGGKISGARTVLIAPPRPSPHLLAGGERGMADPKFTAQKDIDRFWQKIQKTSGCWEWLSSRNDHGYGRFALEGKARAAHRCVWILVNGPIPEGLFVCHHCDNPSCCNPAHLFLGTPKDNMQDAKRKGRIVMPDRPFGDAHPNAKITSGQVRVIRELIASGVEHKTIAQQFHVGQNAIHKIVHRLTWGHVE